MHQLSAATRHRPWHRRRHHAWASRSRLALLLAVVWSLIAACQQPTAGPTPPPSSAPATASGRHSVVLALQRGGGLHVFDAATLQPLARYAVPGPGHHVAVRPDGERLFLAANMIPGSQACCALYALDLRTQAMCRVLEPVDFSLPSPDGSQFYTQLGLTGIEVYDAAGLTRRGNIAGPGGYRLSISPDGRWLAGLTQYAGPSLDLFDVDQGQPAQRLRLPVEARQAGGTWLGNQYYLLAAGSPAWQLYRLAPDATAIGAGQPLAGLDKPARRVEVVANRTSLLAYTPSAWWFTNVGQDSPGAADVAGIREIDPANVRITRTLSPDLTPAQVVASPAGNRLFALEAGTQHTLFFARPARLLSLEAATGTVLAQRDLETDAWSIAAAELPEAMVPRGEIQPTACPHVEPTPRVAPRPTSIATPR